jgi:hypothetical protein
MPSKRILWEARIEAEMVPSFALLDAYLAANVELAHDGFFRVVAGQQFTPFSRQANTSVGVLQMADLAQFQALVPNRQLGISATLNMPYVPWLQLEFGVYNGKGINVVDNLDQNLMYVGRVAFRPVGPRVPYQESALGPDAVWIAGHAAYSQKTLDVVETLTQAGADFYGSYKGFSTLVEYYWGKYTYPAGQTTHKDYRQQGFNAQAGYLLPIPGWFYRRFEITFRFEAVAPNQGVPITAPGDPTQARMSYVAGINYYHRGHDLKLVVNYYHNDEIDSKTASGKDATYNNDALIFLLNYRVK